MVCFLTLPLFFFADNKTPPASQLPTFWLDNKLALIEYMEQVLELICMHMCMI